MDSLAAFPVSSRWQICFIPLLCLCLYLSVQRLSLHGVLLRGKNAFLPVSGRIRTRRWIWPTASGLTGALLQCFAPASGYSCARTAAAASSPRCAHLPAVLPRLCIQPTGYDLKNQPLPCFCCCFPRLLGPVYSETYWPFCWQD